MRLITFLIALQLSVCSIGCIEPKANPADPYYGVSEEELYRKLSGTWLSDDGNIMMMLQKGSIMFSSGRPASPIGRELDGLRVEASDVLVFRRHGILYVVHWKFDMPDQLQVLSSPKNTEKWRVLNFHRSQ